MNQLYRLICPTIGIQTKDGKTNSVVIPVNTLLTLPGGLRDEEGIAVCQWNGGKVSILANDLRERGLRVVSAASARD